MKLTFNAPLPRSATLVVSIEDFEVPISAICALESATENNRSVVIVHLQSGLTFSTTETFEELRDRIGWVVSGS